MLIDSDKTIEKNDLKEVNEQIQIHVPYRVSLLDSQIPTKYKGSVMQIAIAFIISTIFFILHIKFQPFKDESESLQSVPMVVTVVVYNGIWPVGPLPLE